MFKNTAAKFYVFAFDATTNVPKTGDAANITAYVAKDYGAVTVLGDVTAAEQDATNAPGYYMFDAAQAETNGDILLITAKSATADTKVIGAPAVIFTRPTTGWLAPTVAGRTLDVTAANKVNGVVLVDTLTTYTGDTPQTGDSFARIGATGSGLTSLASAANLAVVDGIVDDILLDTAEIGAAGAGLSNINLPNQTMDIVGNITGNLSGSAGSVTGGVTVTTNNDKTGYALTSGERNSVADALLDRDMSTGTDSGSSTVRTVRQALRFLRNKWTLIGTALTVTKEDDATSSWTSVVTADAAADPITANDPAGP